MPDVDQTQNGEGDSTPDDKQNQQPDLGNIVNSAVTSQLKRFIKNEFPALLGEALKPVTEQLAAIKAAPPQPQEGGDGDKKPKVDPQVAALTQQIEEMKAKLTREAEQRAAAEKKARDDRAFSEFKGYLAKSVRPEMLDMVASHLFHIEKMIDVAEDGTATFKGTRTNFGITEEVAYPLKDGVEQWLKGDQAKAFLPAPSTSNTPPHRRQVISPSALPKDLDMATATPAQKIQKAEELALQYQQALGGITGL